MGVKDDLDHLTRAAVERLEPLPAQSPSVANGRYVIKHTEEDSVRSDDITIQTKIWFKSPPLDAQTIRRIRGVKLFAESHDQGFISNEVQGNWTWLEVVVLNTDTATEPKRDAKEQEIACTSHMNKPGEPEYEWHGGETFDRGRDILGSLEAGNVIAVRLCARFANWANTARNGYLVIDLFGDNEPVPIKPIEIRKDQKVPRRRNVNEWYKEAQQPNSTALELSLFIQAMTKFQSLPPEDQLSYFRIAGIHGYPANVPWNVGKAPIPYDADDYEDRMKAGDGGFYCPHNKFTFPTWHRAYMMLFERRLNDIMMELAKTRGEKWVEAARAWRLPYWDWAFEPRLPDIVLDENITIINSWEEGTVEKLKNPMYSFRMPGDKPMGDKSYGDYRIDGNEDGPWDLCSGTNRHSISYYDSDRLWIKGHSVASKVEEALKGPLRTTVKDEKLTLRDAVFRLLNSEYSHKYEHFASTKHEPADKKETKGYLSLESIHNNVHNYTGGGNVAAGCGHMSSVPVAAFDPIFWLHHCNIDRLFFLWQCYNPKRWFLDHHTKAHDGDRDELKPFHINDTTFFDSNGVEEVNHLHYTYDDMDQMADADGELDDVKRNAHINEKYGPGKEAFEGEPTKDVDPIINIIYDRYAFAGLSYTIHFFVGPVKRKTPYPAQESLVGSVYTFSAPFRGPANGGTGCDNCKKQADAGVLSHAQIPLTRIVPIEERGNPQQALAYLQKNLRWVAVLDSGAKIPSKALRDLDITLLLGTNQLKDGLQGVPVFEDHKPAPEWDWKAAEL